MNGRSAVIDPMTEPPLLRMTDVARHFSMTPGLFERVLAGARPRVLKAVDGVSFDIPRRSTLALVGESGCGKSTLARLAVGLQRPTRGSIAFDGVDLATATPQQRNAARRRTQMIFQDPYASLNARWRVADIVAEPIRAHGLASDARDVRRRVDALLAQVGLGASDGRRYPHEFSGGQRQRISIARALSSRPDFLVCDEPTSALDVSVQAQILNLMKDLQEELGLTYLFISHNLAVVRQMADRVGVMYLGRLVELADAETLFRDPGHPYTRMLLDALPDMRMRGRGRAPIPGELPSPLDPPAGCAFAARCPWVAQRCRDERPPPLPRTARAAARVACHGAAEGRLPVWAAGAVP
jgi:peptide/nickel transport system ATP-binding protein